MNSLGGIYNKGDSFVRKDNGKIGLVLDKRPIKAGTGYYYVIYYPGEIKYFYPSSFFREDIVMKPLVDGNV